MSKRRNTSIVLSSSDDEPSPATRSRRKQRCSVPSLSAKCADKRNRKKACLSASRLHDSFDTFPDNNFVDLFYRSKSSPSKELFPLESNRCRRTENLWVEKYHPASLEELAVNKKKIEEVFSWFEDKLSSSKQSQSRNYVLLVTGRAGVGKSTTIQLIASHFGARVFEWHAPIPTLWQEHLYNSTTGVQYTSKLDEFLNFVEHVRKFGLIFSPSMENHKAPFILLLDDLPVSNGRNAFEKLRNSLARLTQCASVPTVILITDYGNSDQVDHNARHMVELQSSLTHSGAHKVTFNPITNNSVKKILTKISRMEHCDVGAAEIDLLANSCGGDIRHAITSLQLFCLNPSADFRSSNFALSSSDASSDLVDSLSSHFSSLCGRDESITLFHALGKLLHNKRNTELSPPQGENSSVLQEKLRRLPLKMGSPEKILTLAHGKSGQVVDFLHENVLDFINNDAVDNAWDVLSYLSDADIVLTLSNKFSSTHNAAENILQSVAASLAMRGVLFGNCHPSSSRWHSFRKPKLWEVEQSTITKNKQLKSTELPVSLRWRRDQVLSSAAGVESICLGDEVNEDGIEDW